MMEWLADPRPVLWSDLDEKFYPYDECNAVDCERANQVPIGVVINIIVLAFIVLVAAAIDGLFRHTIGVLR